MSKRHAYEIYISEQAPNYVVFQLEDKLDSLFCGHYSTTEYGFFAEDAPAVGEAFANNNPRYIKERKFIHELNQPCVSDWDTHSELSAKPNFDYNSRSPNDSDSYASAVSKCILKWANDTSCTSGTKDITNKL